MILTREKVSEAIAFGKSVLPKLTAVELASTLEVSLTDMLKCIKANQSSFKFDTDKNIVELQTNKAMLLSSNEVSAWYEEKNKGKKSLAVQTQKTISDNTNSPIRWLNNFSFTTSVFIDPNKDGKDAIESALRNYGPEVSARMAFLGRIDGGGSSIDKHVYGVVLTSDEVEKRCLNNTFPLYFIDWAYRDMSKTLEWVDINTGVISSDEKTVETVNASPEQVIVTKPFVNHTTSNSSEIVPKKVWDRRKPSKEQLLAERQKMIDTLIENGMKKEDAERLISNEKIANARIIFESNLQELKKKRKKFTVSDIKSEIKAKAQLAPQEEQKAPEPSCPIAKNANQASESFFRSFAKPSEVPSEIVEPPKSTEQIASQENGVTLLQTLLQNKL